MSAFFVSGCETPDRKETLVLAETMDNESPDNPFSARAMLTDGEGNGISGEAVFSPHDEGVHVEAFVEGLRPDTTYALYVHEVGDCSNPSAPSMGSPFDAAAELGGLPPGAATAAGRLGTLGMIGDHGGHYEEIHASIRLDGSPNVVDRAVVLYAAPAAIAEEPGPNNGDILACGVVNEDISTSEPATDEAPAGN